MKIEPLAPHPIVKIKPVKNDKKQRHRKEQQKKQQSHVEEQEEETFIQHIDEVI